MQAAGVGASVSASVVISWLLVAIFIGGMRVGVGVLGNLNQVLAHHVRPGLQTHRAMERCCLLSEKSTGPKIGINHYIGFWTAPRRAPRVALALTSGDVGQVTSPMLAMAIGDMSYEI